MKKVITLITMLSMILSCASISPMCNRPPEKKEGMRRKTEETIREEADIRRKIESEHSEQRSDMFANELHRIAVLSSKDHGLIAVQKKLIDRTEEMLEGYQQRLFNESRSDLVITRLKSYILDQFFIHGFRALEKHLKKQ